MIAASKLAITFTESSVFDTFEGPVVFTTFAALNCALAKIANAISGAYAKTDVRIEWADGSAHEAKLEISRNDAGDIIGRHVRRYLEFYGGDEAPAHMTHDEWMMHRRMAKDGTREYCADRLANYLLADPTDSAPLADAITEADAEILANTARPDKPACIHCGDRGVVECCEDPVEIDPTDPAGGEWYCPRCDGTGERACACQRPARLADVKTGDELARFHSAYGSKSVRIVKVARVLSRSLRVEGDSRHYRRTDGRCVGAGSTLIRFWVELPTEESRAAARAQLARQRMIRAVRRLSEVIADPTLPLERLAVADVEALAVRVETICGEIPSKNG